MYNFKISYNLQDIKAVMPYKTIYARGSDYYKEGRVTGISYKCDADGYLLRSEALVRGDGGTYHVCAEFDRKFGITEYACDCPANAKFDGACKHVIALLLTLYNADDLSVSQPVLRPAVSIRDLEHLTEYYTQSETACAPGDILLSGEICDIDNRLSLEFRIGRGYKYVLRDIFTFVGLVNSGKTASYGKNLEFIHTQAAFMPECRPLLDFLTAAVCEYNEYHQLFSPYAAISDRRRLILSPHQLDEFFNLYANTEVPCAPHISPSGCVLFAEGNPCGFKVTGDAELCLEADGPIKALLRGNGSRYVFTGSALCRCENAFARRAIPVLESLQKIQGHRLPVAGPAAAPFVSAVMRRLCEIAPVADYDRITERFPVLTLDTSTYLDYDGRAICARPVFRYGETTVHAGDDRDETVVRDLPAENRITGLLTSYHFQPDEGDTLKLDDEEQIYLFLKDGIPALNDLCEVLGGQGFENLKLKKQQPIRFSVGISSGILNIHMEHSDFTPDELASVIEAYQLNRRYVRLKNGTFLELHDQSAGILSVLDEDFGLKKADAEKGLAVPASRALYVNSLLSRRPEISVRYDDTFTKLVDEVQSGLAEDCPLPEALEPILRNYQKTGFHWLHTLERFSLGGILADDMGLGKTIQIIALLASPGEGASIIVCPASLIFNWKSELDRFYPSLRAATVTGSAQERAAIIARVSEFDILITSYDLLRNDVDLYADINFRVCVADEAQYIKNHTTKNARAIKTVKARARFALTGTPVENSLSDLWSIFDFILPGYLPPYTRFRRLYEIPAAHTGQTPERLTMMTAPFILRRLKTTVLSELPDKIETTLYAAFDKQQSQLYQATLARTRKEFRQELSERGIQADRIRILALLTRLRQICCHPVLYTDKYKGKSAKLELCMEIVHESIEAGHRILLFSQFTSMLSILSARLAEEGVSHCILTGETKTAERMTLVNEFNNGGASVFLISLKAGGTGLNLTAADVVIHYDPWWNFAAQNQATDRAHRIGQKNRVQVIRLIAKETIEEQLLLLQDHKTRISNSVVHEGETFITSLSQKELTAILG